MLIDFSALSPSRIYFTMIQTLLPRPIAWVLSDSGAGRFNLAPFSYFNGVSSDPPLIMLSIGHKPDGDIKDTRRNIIERSHFVVHIPHRELAEAVTESSRVLAFGESELQRLALATVAFGDFPLPRLADCRIAYACECHQVIEVGDAPQALVLGLVKAVYIDDRIATLSDSGRLQVDPLALDPLARLGGDDYGLLGGTVTIKRPR
ncbi:MAG: flavin reductase family protein [Spongiibacteraceae bacterium]|jgi:flavin reductase (DIM6/NTAB) family NADH-FMN oxidoreductase RutF|nr:flavin reductase family protein [Spongiibacteraceae bacterium]